MYIIFGSVIYQTHFNSQYLLIYLLHYIKLWLVTIPKSIDYVSLLLLQRRTSPTLLHSQFHKKQFSNVWHRKTKLIQLQYRFAKIRVFKTKFVVFKYYFCLFISFVFFISIIYIIYCADAFFLVKFLLKNAQMMFAQISTIQPFLNSWSQNALCHIYIILYFTGNKALLFHIISTIGEINNKSIYLRKFCVTNTNRFICFAICVYDLRLRSNQNLVRLNRKL